MNGKIITYILAKEDFKRKKDQIILEMRNVSYTDIVQTNLIIPELIVEDNIKYYAYCYGIERTSFEKIVNNYGLEKIKNQKASKIGDKNIQKLNLALAMTGNSDVIITANPFENLGMLTVNTIKEDFIEKRTNGKTIFILSDKLLGYDEFSDEVVDLSNRSEVE